MQKLKIFSLKNKILFVILLLILVFGSMATIFVYFQTKNELLKVKREELVFITQSQSEKIAQRLNTTKNILVQISEDRQVKEFLENPVDDDREEITRILDYHIIDDRYLAIYLLDEKGLTHASTDSRFVGQDYSFRQYFRQAIDEGWSVESAVGVTSGELGYYYSRQIKNSNGNPIGVAVVKINPSSIESLINIDSSGPINYFLTDSCGIVLASNRTDLKYKSLGKLSSQAINDCRIEERFSGIQIDSLDYTEILNAVASGEVSGTRDIIDDYDNEQEIVAFYKISGFPFIFTSEVSQDLFFSSSVQLSVTVAVFVLAAAFFAFVFITILVNKFLSPINELRTAAKEYGRGNFSYRVSTFSNDELGELAKLFNQMADQIKFVYENIEDKIKEKTQELERTNKFLVGRELKMIEMKEKLKKLGK